MVGVFVSCAAKTPPSENKNEINMQENTAKLDTTTLGSGCFWCVEAIFQSLEGVESAVSGYSGGGIKNPSYKEVCTGRTGHAEVVQIVYNPALITFKELLEVFFQTHDPTTLNRQGNDVGTQYRSAIFYHTEEQKQIAQQVIEDLNKAGAWNAPIVTEVTPYTNFYKAENYHQDYYNLNGDQPYCTFVIKPKMEKFKKAFGDKMKK